MKNPKYIRPFNSNDILDFLDCYHTRARMHTFIQDILNEELFRDEIRRNTFEAFINEWYRTWQPRFYGTTKSIDLIDSLAKRLFAEMCSDLRQHKIELPTQLYPYVYAVLEETSCSIFTNFSKQRMKDCLITYRCGSYPTLQSAIAECFNVPIKYQVRSSS